MGTLFEALLWLAVLEQQVDAASTVRRLMRWVDANVDPTLLQQCVADDDGEASLQLDSFTMRALFERALPPPTPPPRVRAALSWAPLPVAPAASRALFSDHDFDVDGMEPHHCTIKGSYAAPTWHGCFCRSCSAMLVVRQVSNRRSDFFIVGSSNARRCDCRPGSTTTSTICQFTRPTSQTRFRSETCASGFWPTTQTDGATSTAERVARVTVLQSAPTVSPVARAAARISTSAARKATRAVPYALRL